MRRLIHKLIRRRHLEQDLEAELAFHEEMAAASGNEIRLGNRGRIKEEARDVWRWNAVENAWRDVIHAARRLCRTPGFTVATVLTLALAIGANAAIFTMVHRVLLNPLPYPDSDRLIDLDHGATRINVPAGMGIKTGLYFYYQDRARTLDSIAIFTMGGATLSGGGEPEQIRITRATPTLAQVLRVRPALGRWFTPEESEPGSPQVAVLSHGLWLRRYGGDSGLIGKAVTLNGMATEVIGIMPPDYAFPDPGIDMWLPASVTRASGLGLWVYRGVARLREGVNLDQARAELNTLLRDVPQTFPNDPLARATGPEFGVMSTARILKETIIDGVAGALWILLGAVGIVLLVACLNVANLFLVRAETRRQEMTVRHALGAGAGAIARLLFAESALLSLTGGLLGLILAWSAVRLLVSSGPATLPRLEEVRLDGVVAAFTFLLSGLAACGFGSMPLLRGISFSKFHDTGRRMTGTRGQHYARHVLMGGQVALALVLLVSSGLMVKSFQKLRAIDPGFNPASTFTFGIGLPPRDYPTKEAAIAAHRRVLDSIATVPGVSHVSSTTCLPFDGPCFSNGIMVEGREGPVVETNLGNTSFRAVEGGYFQAMGIPLIRGRVIERSDVERSEPVAVVNQRFVDLVFPNDDPIGKRVSWTLPAAKEGASPKYTWLTIVGVVPNTPTRTLREPSVVPHLYMPLSMTGRFDAPTWEYIGPRVGTLNYVVRASAISDGLLSSIRRAVNTVDSNLALAQVSTLEERLARTSAGLTFNMVLLTIAAAVALLLGLVGIYGVVSYIVSQRTSEIGVRLALGAAPRSVTAMIVGQSGLVTLVGIAVGLAATLGTGRLIESLLYGVSPRDPVVLAGTTFLLVIVAIVACWLPARRAARVSPVRALHAN
jgi:predicted permease